MFSTLVRSTSLTWNGVRKSEMDHSFFSSKGGTTTTTTTTSSSSSSITNNVVGSHSSGYDTVVVKEETNQKQKKKKSHSLSAFNLQSSSSSTITTTAWLEKKETTNNSSTGSNIPPVSNASTAVLTSSVVSSLPIDDATSTTSTISPMKQLSMPHPYQRHAFSSMTNTKELSFQATQHHQRQSSRRQRSSSPHKPLLLLQYQYIARDVQVMLGKNWIRGYETKTLILQTGKKPGIHLQAIPLNAVDAISASYAHHGRRRTSMSSAMSMERMFFELSAHTHCHRKKTNGIKLKGPNGFRVRIRFTTCADADIWLRFFKEAIALAQWLCQLKTLDPNNSMKNSMTSVYEARYIPTQQEYIVKTIPRTRVEGCREVLALKKLASEPLTWNWTQDYRIFETVRDILVIMPKHQGVTLLQHVQSFNGVMSEQDAAGIIYRLCLALELLHRVGIVHGDIKLENVLLVKGQSLEGEGEEEEEQVRLIDFGGACFHGNSNRLTKQKETKENNVLIGTPGYIAPERIQGRITTPVADVFSVGVILYQFLIGKHPYPVRSGSQLTLKDASSLDLDYVKSQLDTKGVSVPAQELIIHMLQPDPTQRIEILDVLQHAWFFLV